MKKHFLLAGFAALMLFACNNKPVSELTRVYHGTGQKRKDAGCSFRLR